MPKHSAPAPVPGSPLIEISPETHTITWQLAGADAGRRPRTVPWFPTVGVLDYARADRLIVPVQPRHESAACGLWPAFGDALIVRPDLAAVFWRVGSVLHSAPIRADVVDFTAAAAVKWGRPSQAGVDLDQLAVIEHNLAQCSALPTVDPPLHVVQVDANGRLSLAYLVADVDGSPVIGPTPPHWRPAPWPDQLDAASADGLHAYATLFQSLLSASTDEGAWQFLSPTEALATLAGLGFAVTGAAAERPGLVAALRAARDEQWTPGWFDGARLLTLARFTACPNRGGPYLFHDGGSRPVAYDAEHDPDYFDMIGLQGPADVETLPGDQLVRVGASGSHGGLSGLVPAGRVALHEPVLIEGTLPILDDYKTRWSATCRRCGAAMSCGLVGRHDFVPYVHDLAAEIPGRGPGDLWCPAHPDTDRRRPHAAVCRVLDRD